MPEYLSPGVYMEEFEIGARPIEGVSTSTAGFLGETERGPTTPCLITSWLQYQRVYGGYFGTDKYLPGSVEGFFKNGGSRCYIARIVKSGNYGASTAKLELKLDINNALNITLDEAVVLIIEAIGEGKWGSRIAVKLSSASLTDKIKLDVLYWKTESPVEKDLNNSDPDYRKKVLKDHPTSVYEIFDNISISKISSDYFDKTVNGISNLIKISLKPLTEYEGTPKNFSKDSYLCLQEGCDETSTDSGNSKQASLALQSIDKIDPLKCADYVKQMLIIKAKKPGKCGNNIGLRLLKRDPKGIKLEIHPETGDPETFEGDDPGALQDSFKKGTQAIRDQVEIEFNNNTYHEAKEALNTPIKLDPPVGTETHANLILQSIDAIDCEELNEFKYKILKVTATGTDGEKIGIELKKGESGIILVVHPATGNPIQYDGESAEDLKRKVNKDPTTLITIDIENNPYKEAKKALVKILYLEGGKDKGSTTFTSTDYLREDTDKPGLRKGLTSLREIEDISLIYVPNAYDISNGDLVTKLIDHCESLKYRFAVLDAKPEILDVNKWDPRTHNPTDHAAFYYPWIKVTNPETGMLQLMPPGGYIAGIYARSDTERGVHKAPANEVIKGASDLQFQIMKGEQDVLNPRGVNVIRAFSGRGILVWGARTLSSNTLWKYINVRRLFIYIEASLEKGTQWVVFEPNDDRLWGRVKATITQFLTGVWRSGALMGTTHEEAFFVKCDRSTMTQDDIDNGRLICIIGIAPVKPAEFVIFRIAQWQGGSAATE